MPEFDMTIKPVYNMTIKPVYNVVLDHWEKPIHTANRCVRNHDNQVNPVVVDNMAREVEDILLAPLHENQIDLDTLFEEACLSNLVLMSGGNRCTLWGFLRKIFVSIDQLPVTQKDVNRAVSETRNMFQRAIEYDQYKSLAKIYLDCFNPRLYQDYDWLFTSRAILQYTDTRSYTLVSPLVQDLHYFKEALKELQ
ncbi:hypothetical protein QT972_09700 [Microcoleus sp. herbarium7]|uniref:hypothetical protein n=1 Tax=Microcoleus sp. herbarium7 TaxID=3055435 RepID=UPI002FD13228